MPLFCATSYATSQVAPYLQYLTSQVFLTSPPPTYPIDKSQIPDALQSYYRRRIVRSAIVQGMSRFSSDIIISAFSTPFKFSEFLKQGASYKYLNFSSIMTWNLQSFLPLIFYAQFSYLYSFAPSGFNASKIKELVLKSLARNKLECSQVYKGMTDRSVTFFSAKSMSFMRFDKASKEITKIADAADFRQEVCTIDNSVC